jgi:IstB-like ATP binding protein
MSVVEPALLSCLRTLKLSGMLETLDARLAQARAGELGHLDFLQVLCHDEITRRETVAMSRRLRRAHFEQQLTLEGFDFAASPKLPAAQIRDLAALRWLVAGESSSSTGRSALGRATSHKRSGISRSGKAPRSASPRPAGCSPRWPVGTPTAASTSGWPNSSGPSC